MTDDSTHLLQSLDRIRRTLRWKTGDLDADGLTATVGVSTLTPGGLLKHLAFLEHLYFGTMVFGRPLPEPFDAITEDTDPDWAFTSAAADPPEQLYAWYDAAVTAARSALDEAVADGGLDRRAVYYPGDRDDLPTLRELVSDMVEEYARHTGHVDLIREAYDGLVGEDAPAAST